MPERKTNYISSPKTLMGAKISSKGSFLPVKLAQQFVILKDRDLDGVLIG
jgi:hypothetical protein